MYMRDTYLKYRAGHRDPPFQASEHVYSNSAALATAQSSGGRLKIQCRYKEVLELVKWSPLIEVYSFHHHDCTRTT